MQLLKISLLVFILQISLISQAPDTIWTKIIGEELSEDWGISFIEANDSGYVIVGATLKESPEDLWILKTDKNGNLIWSKTYGSENYIEQAWSIKKTLDDNFIVCGTKTVPPLNGNIWLLKFTTNGDTLWTKNYSGTGNVFGRSVEPTRDGGFILLGETVTVFFDLGLIMIKTNSIGEITWTKYFDQTASLDGNYIVKETIDNKYVVLSTVNKANSDVYLFKTDSNGDTIWTRTYGGIGKEAGNCIIETSDGGYIITGYADPPISIHQDDLWVFKTNSSGEVIWSKTFGADTTEEKGTWLIETPNNEYLIVGERQLEAWLDIWILKINSMGDTLWTKTIGGANTETAYSVLLTSDNEYLVLGWSASFGFSNVWLIKLAGDIVNIEDVNNSVPNEFYLSQNYPNPFNPTTIMQYTISSRQFVTLKVYDLLGREIATLVNEEKLAGEYEVEFEGSKITSGIYFYQLKAGEFSETKKMILLK